MGKTGAAKRFRLDNANARSRVNILSKLILEILEQKIPPRQGRTNPRVVKKPRSKFPSRKPIHSGAGTKHQPLTLFILNTA